MALKEDNTIRAVRPETMETPCQKPRVLALANQKGGVGKTTTAINLGTALAAVEKKVLIIDMDPQGNASTGLGVHPENRHITSYELLMDGVSIEEAAVQTAVPGLSIIPSSVDLTGAEVELVTEIGRECKLRNVITESTLDFDYILIDCPPSLGLLTLNTLVAAHAVMVPVQVEFFALEGLGHLIGTIDLVRRSLNPKLEIQGVVLTMYDKRMNLAESVAADVREHFGNKVYDTIIPRNVRVSESPSHGVPVLIYDHRCVGSQAYIHLASEMIKREASRLAGVAA